jgi:hypothetical protein
MFIFNTTDKSYGYILSNTGTAIVSTPLMGGYANTWVTGNTYLIGANMVDVATGIPMPFTVPAGFSIQVAGQSWSFNQDSEVIFTVDGYLVVMPGAVSSGTLVVTEVLAGLSTVSIDPTLSKSHTVDIIALNKGLNTMYGAANFICILQEGL